MILSGFIRTNHASRAALRLAAWGLVLVLLSGCAAKLNRAVDSFYSGDSERALELLADDGWEDKRNRLLELMERGTILHYQGRYQDSSSAFLEADELIASFEKISISEQGMSLVGNEWLTKYKGEYSERLWVHTYLMMNYLLSGHYDDALVEANRALKRLEDEPEALRRAYFTRALMALCYANVAEDNDALLLYRGLAEDLTDTSLVAADIVYHARRLGMMDLVEAFEGRAVQQRSDRDAELVLFFSSGRIAEKEQGTVFIPPSHRFSFPRYGSTSSFIPYLKPSSGSVVASIPTALGDVAEDALDARKVGIIAKETIRLATKEALAQSVGNHNDAAAESLVRIAFFLMENADVRCWKTLPGQMSLLRVALPPGRHKLKIQTGLNRTWIDIPEFELRPGQRYFHSVRSLP